jgi:hypothetical protein
MAEERRPISIDDDESHRLHAVWSRSGKRLIVTVTTTQAHAQVELRPAQVEALVEYLSRTVASTPADR